jgi:hypothetical protein
MGPENHLVALIIKIAAFADVLQVIQGIFLLGKRSVVFTGILLDLLSTGELPINLSIQWRMRQTADEIAEPP